MLAYFPATIWHAVIKSIIGYNFRKINAKQLFFQNRIKKNALFTYVFDKFFGYCDFEEFGLLRSKFF